MTEYFVLLFCFSFPVTGELVLLLRVKQIENFLFNFQTPNMLKTEYFFITHWT